MPGRWRGKLYCLSRGTSVSKTRGNFPFRSTRSVSEKASTSSLRFLVIPAAGLGSRIRSVCPEMCKELIPVGSKPAIQYAIEEGLDAGVEQIVVVLGPGKDNLRQLLSDLSLPITFAWQEEPTGEADAIALTEPLVGGSAFAVIYPDCLCLPGPGALQSLVAVFKKSGQDVMGLTTITEENDGFFSDAGKVDLESVEENLFRIRGLLPKGSGIFKRRFELELRSAGMGVWNSHYFDAIRRVRPTITEGEFTDGPVAELILKEKGILGMTLPGRVFDIGHPAGYRYCLDQLSQGERPLESDSVQTPS